MDNIQKISLDILNNSVYKQAYTKQYDTGRVLKIKLLEDGMPVDLSGATVVFKAKKPDNTIVYSSCGIDVKNSEVSVELTEQMTLLAGKIPFELEITTVEDKLARVSVPRIYRDSYTASILKQLKNIITPVNNSNNVYKFISDIKMINAKSNNSGVSPKIVLRSISNNKIFSVGETVPMTTDFKDVIITSDVDLNNFICDIQYTGSTVIKSITGCLKVEKAVVTKEDIESVSEFNGVLIGGTSQSSDEECKVAKEDLVSSLSRILV